MPSKVPILDKQPSSCFQFTAESFYHSALLFSAVETHPELLMHIPDHNGYSRSPILSNAAHAIELALKSCLRALGKSSTELRQLGGRTGHDLTLLHRACVAEGMKTLVTTDVEKDALQELSERHASKDLNFPDIELHRGCPTIDTTLDLARRAISLAKEMNGEADSKHHNTSTAAKSFREKKADRLK